MKVKEFMTRRTLVAGTDTDVWAVIQIMRQSRIGSILIFQDGRLIGIFTERDLLNKYDFESDIKKELIIDYATLEPICIQQESSVEDAMTLMLDKKIRHLPVLKEEEVVGILSIRDLIRLERNPLGAWVNNQTLVLMIRLQFVAEILDDQVINEFLKLYYDKIGRIVSDASGSFSSITGASMAITLEHIDSAFEICSALFSSMDTTVVCFSMGVAEGNVMKNISGAVLPIFGETVQEAEKLVSFAEKTNTKLMIQASLKNKINKKYKVKNVVKKKRSEKVSRNCIYLIVTIRMK